ncbi:hypothetical protein DFQ03_3795 [Maribacter caenipelagi]|uniref:Anti-sigma factor n=1 Tax=Maribacter caenipelagi TaxID=1447781 RepID=A0A4R7CW60_9FLAO|nr:hypothetical protein [Maribacter caenipelagi]TDS10902.1 hypothetical protein DFQ03_3795 [Maribacter caenipelagi]
METDKFEKHIKAKFQERKILPSENAWAKIASELNDDKSKKKPVYLWMGVAAGIVVLVGIALFYFNGNAVSNELPTEIVGTEKENKLEDVIIKESIPFKSEEEVVEATSETKTNVKEVKVEEPIEPKIQESKVLDDKIEVTVNQVPTNETIQKLVPDEIIDSKVAAIITQVSVLEQNSTVTDAEIDSLLKRAQDEILREKIFNKDKSVDAMALLTEVEDELDQSFRDQIFDSLKAGFIKVRTAVADRNN